MSQLNFFPIKQLFFLSNKSIALISLLSLIMALISTPSKVNAVNSQINLPVESESSSLNPKTPKVTLSPPQVSVPSVTKNQGKNSFIDTNRYASPSPQPQMTTPTVIVKSRDSDCQTATQGRISNCGSSPVRISRQSAKVTISRNSNYHQPQVRKITNSNVNYRPTYMATRGNNFVPYRVRQEPQPQPRIYTHADRTQVIIPSDSKTALLFPLSLPARITSAFGWRIHPITGNQAMHYGTDLAAPMGTPVLASYGGEVAIADNLGGYGLTVILRHLNHTQESRYAHLSEIFVKVGEWVKQGDVIGLVGSSGLSTGSHLHFEWRHNTQQGWVATDARLHLEYALDNLIKSMETAQN